jgi:hypothetical protein
MPRALFVTYGGGHVKMVIPVALELQRRGWEVHALGLTMAGPALRAAEIATLGFRDLVCSGDERALDHGRVLAAVYHSQEAGIAWEESVAYLGLSYADLERRLGSEEAARRFAREGRMALLPLDPLERLFHRVRPHVVVATNSPRAEEAAIRVARRLGVPSVCMVDLFGTDFDKTHLLELDYADRVTVLMDYVRDYVLAAGRRPSEIIVTGSPAFDQLASPDLTARAQELRQRNRWTGKKLILWVSQSQPEPAANLPGLVLERLLQALERHPDWHLVYRTHPSENPLPVPLPRGASLSDRTQALAPLLSATDAVVVMTSTVGMEAALLDKPVVKVCLSPFNKYAPYEKMGLALPVNQLEDLESQLQEALGDGVLAQSLAAARKLLPRPGTATARVADVIESLYGENHSAKGRESPSFSSRLSACAGSRSPER